MRRLRWSVVGALAVLATVICTPLAIGSSGGAGTSPRAKAGASARAEASRHRTTGKRNRLAHGARGNAFATRGMWIWYLSRSDGGNLASLVADAHRYGISTLLIKSGDGSGVWSQFNPSVVATLHANGLRVCGWQYVYGINPVAEAQVGAAAVRNGADCLVVDAEGEYEGKYLQAQTYMRTLRSLVGTNFPIGLAGFPYVDYHPGYPYSVFLGPGGAQFNLPQMYWVDIGVNVDSVYAHTYAFNRIYRRGMFPLGQVYNSPRPNQIRRFRQLSRAYGAAGVSWWDWQEASFGAWLAVSQRVGWPGQFSPSATVASFGRGARGDVVVWAQEHLLSAGQNISVDGALGSNTTSAVLLFQQAHGLLPDGVIGPATWQALLRYRPVAVRWTSRGARIATVARGSTTAPVPASARLPARRYEIGRSPGRG
jgi:hypothetical protein